MLGKISNLPIRHHIFTRKNRCIYVLDDCSVQIMPKVKETLPKKGYVYIRIEGRVTAGIQITYRYSCFFVKEIRHA